jgi:hypothetical protein
MNLDYAFALSELRPPKMRRNEAVAAIDAKGRGVVDGERQEADIGGEPGGGVPIGATGPIASGRGSRS